MRTMDHTGAKYGGIKVIGRAQRPRYWTCECLVCGQPTEVATANLRRRNSCGCARFLTRSNHGMWSGAGELSGTFVANMRGKAKHRGLAWEVDAEFLWNLFESQGGRCALSGLPIELPKRCYGPKTASLDRIDSSNGYAVGNVQWLHKDVQFMKYTLSQSRLVELCNQVSEYQRGKIHSADGLALSA